MTITYQINQLLRPEEVADLFRSSGIRRPADDLKRIQRMLDHADLTISAWDEEQLVGLARAITDYAYCCYLSDLAVSKAYQKRGIGTQLLHSLKESLSDEVAIVLLSAPSALEYYPRVGFDKADHAFFIRRQR